MARLEGLTGLNTMMATTRSWKYNDWKNFYMKFGGLSETQARSSASRALTNSNKWHKRNVLWGFNLKNNTTL